MERFEKLHAYQAAYKLCLGTYKVTQSLPAPERFALASQMRRAAYSVIGNIAEGSRASTDKDRSRYNQLAIASLEELKSYYQFARDLGYCQQTTKERARELASQTGKMLVGLNRSYLRKPLTVDRRLSSVD